MDAAALTDIFGESLRKQLRHASLSRPYFEEFPLRNAGGLPRFLRRFVYDDYYMATGHLDQELVQYISYLLDYARAQGRVPVVKLCRWGLRTAWLQEHFASVCIYVLRAPDAMFRSYWSFGQQCSYFIVRMILIIAKNSRTDIFRRSARELGIPFIRESSLSDEVRQAAAVAERLDVQSIRDVVFLLWSLNLAHNASTADMVIDVDLLSQRPEYREQVEADLHGNIGESFSFDDFVPSTLPSAPGEVLSARGRDLSREALQSIVGRLDATKDFSDESNELLGALFG